MIYVLIKCGYQVEKLTWAPRYLQGWVEGTGQPPIGFSDLLVDPVFKDSYDWMHTEFDKKACAGLSKSALYVRAKAFRNKDLFLSFHKWDNHEARAIFRDLKTKCTTKTGKPGHRVQISAHHWFEDLYDWSKGEAAYHPGIGIRWVQDWGIALKECSPKVWPENKHHPKDIHTRLDYYITRSICCPKTCK